MSLLGIDLGTTGCKAGVFGLDGACLAQDYREYDMLHPQPGWSELDSLDVWEKTKAVIAGVAARVRRDPITALSVSSFGEAFVPVSRDRRILDRSILCVDDRGVEHVDRLCADFGAEALYAINPNVPGPHYSLPKLLWMREHRAAMYDQAAYFLLWADLVGFMLGGEAVTNNSHANRTLLMDVDRNDWSDALLAWSGIPREKLGRIVPGGTVVGTVADALADELGLPHGVSIVAGGHDQCCNALGCGAVQDGRAVFGLGSFDCITPVFSKPADTSWMRRAGLNREHHVIPGFYVAFIFNSSGLLVKWFREVFAADTPPPPGVDVYSFLDRELPDEPTSLLVLPHFSPPVSPHCIRETAGVMVGLKDTTRRGEILKAIREGCALYFVESLAVLRKAGLPVAEFIASGGGAKSDAGLRIRADVFGLPIVRPRITEAGVLGAAMLAGMATGALRSVEEAVALFVHYEQRVEPDMRRHEIYRDKHALYQQLYPSLKSVLRKL